MYRGVAALLLGSVGISCAPLEAPVEAPDDAFERCSTTKVEVWHRRGNGGVVVIEVAPSAVRAHLAHGDWFNPIYVDPAAARGGNGLAATPYRRLTDALAQAAAMRAATGETEWAGDLITIHAARGVYTGSFSAAALAAHPEWEPLPVLIDVPGVALLGSTVPRVVGGIPSGTYPEASASKLVSDVPLGPGDSQALVVVTDTVHDDGTAWAGNGARVSGWVFASGHTGATRGGDALVALRVSDVRLASSVVGERFTAAVDGRYADLSIDGVYANNTEICTFCLNGGDYRVRRSRVGDGLVGVLVGPGVGPLPLSLGAHVGRTIPPTVVPDHGRATLRVDDSDLTGHTRNKISSSVRIMAVGTGQPADLDTSDIDVTVRDTRLGGSTNGVSLDAGFVSPAFPTPVSTMTVTLEGNDWRPVTQTPLLATFTRAQIAVGQGTANPATVPYLSGADWTIDTSGDVPTAAAWIDHPATFRYGDPSVDLGNTLEIDGAVVARGTCQGEFPANVCTPATP